MIRRFFAAWWRYWFREAPLLDLAIFRILIIGLQLYLLVFSSRYNMVALTEVSEVPPFLYEPLFFFDLITRLLGGHHFTINEIGLIWGATACAGVAALLGLGTRLSVPLFAIGVSTLQLWTMSHGDVHHPEAAMMIALGLLSFSPSGAVLSLDAMMRREPGRATLQDQLSATSREAKWLLLLIQWFFGLMYLSACYAKLRYGEGHWANGITLQYAMAQDGLRWNPLLGLWLSHFYWVALAGQWFILFFQGTFFLSVVFPKLKWFYIPVGMVMHVFIYLMFKAPFFQWSALYFAFVPWSAIFVRLKALRRPEGFALADQSGGVA
jgi:hypothetical protein